MWARFSCTVHSLKVRHAPGHSGVRRRIIIIIPLLSQTSRKGKSLSPLPSRIPQVRTQPEEVTNACGSVTVTTASTPAGRATANIVTGAGIGFVHPDRSPVGSREPRLSTQAVPVSGIGGSGSDNTWMLRFRNLEARRKTEREGRVLDRGGATSGGTQANSRMGHLEEKCRSKTCVEHTGM